MQLKKSITCDNLHSANSQQNPSQPNYCARAMILRGTHTGEANLLRRSWQQCRSVEMIIVYWSACSERPTSRTDENLL